MSARSRSSRSDSSRRLRSAQLEEQLVRKRQVEYERLNYWNNNCTYFKTWDFNTALHSNWAENRNSLGILQKAEQTKNENKKETIEGRRKKLRELFEREQKELMEELKRKTKEPTAMEELNVANVELLLREEEARRKERDLKMYHYWRQNQPTLRDFESKQHSAHVKKSWLQQVIEKRKEKEAEEKKIMEHVKELKRIQEEHDQKEQELKAEKKKNELELKSFLEKQMELMKCKEEQEKILKEEETETLKTQNELDKLLEEKKRLEERRKRTDLSLHHKNQYQLLLRRQAKEVQDKLETDRILLERIAAEKKYESAITAARLEQYKRDLETARKICKTQSELEKLRNSQAEYLFDEEARDLYKKQEAEWKKENECRQKLMNDVLNTLQAQIKEKLIENLKRQDEARQFREQILKSLEKANRELEECKEKEKKALEGWKKDLDQQILEKKLEVYYKKKKQEEDKENELKAKKEEEEKLCKELTRMYLSEYQPRVVGRRKFAHL